MASAIRQLPRPQFTFPMRPWPLAPKAHGPKGQYQAPKSIILSHTHHDLSIRGCCPLLLESLQPQSHAMTDQAKPSLLVTILYLPYQDCFARPCFATQPGGLETWGLATKQDMTAL